MASGGEIVSATDSTATAKVLFLCGRNNPFCRRDAETVGDGVVRIGSVWRCFRAGFVGALLELWGGFGVALRSHEGGFEVA